MRICLCGQEHPEDTGLTRLAFWGQDGTLFELDPATPHHLDIVWTPDGHFVGACLPRALVEQAHGPLIGVA
jgi:hypothetical protein